MNKGQRIVHTLTKKVREAAKQEDWDGVWRATCQLKQAARNLLAEHLLAIVDRESEIGRE